MKTRALPAAIACSLGLHGLLLAMLFFSNVHAVAHRQNVENVPFITASLVFAMNGQHDQNASARRQRAREHGIVNEPLKRRLSVDQAKNAESPAPATERDRNNRVGGVIEDVPVSMRFPSSGNVDAGEPSSLGRASGGKPEVALGGGPPGPESMRTTLPRYLSVSRPAYPVMARMRGQEGTVLLTVEVLADGRTGDIRIKQSSGYNMLDHSALNAARSWRFEPARTRNMPLAMAVDVPVRFSLMESD